MATFYIQLENRLLQISGDLTAENVSKALGYVPVSSNVTNELSQRVDNITFDSLKDNPFLQDGSGELNIVDKAGNIIAKIDAEGLHSVDFIAGEHRLSNKTDKTYVDEAIKNVEVDLTGYATEEYVNNIDFYNIKDNPIVNNGDGKLLFVDENGYIGLQLEENGLYVKDVIADGHTLSQKANKSDIPSLDGYATESYVTTNLQNYATKDEVSDLVDMSVVTELQGKVNTLVGEDSDKSVRTIANEELAALLLAGNDNLQSLLELAAWIDEHPEDASAMNEAIQTNTSNITKLDSAYKEADVKVLTDANEYTDNINFYTIKDNPIVNGEAGSLTFVDETGYIGLKVTEDGIIAKDVVTPEHKLSDKANTSDVPTKVSQLQNDANYITESDIPSLDEYVTETELSEKGYLTEHQDISHLAEKSEIPSLDGYATEQWVEDKNYLTEHLDIAHLASKEELNSGLLSKQDTLTSGTTIKTINGESILGSGDIVINSSSEEITITDGVYAVDTNGKLINYNTADSSCLGVALVAGEHKFMIAKSDASDGSNSTLYWTKSYPELSLTNYNKADGTNGTGYLPKPDGTFGGSTHLSGDFTTWKAGALSDFNGKANTAIIAAASSDAREMCTVLNTFNASDSHNDWYVPACGQLALMYLNMTEINAALAKIGGTALAAGRYWSSSEYSSDIAWYMNFNNGYVDNDDKDDDYRVRFVRDLIITEPLKEKVTELESSVSDLKEEIDKMFSLSKYEFVDLGLPSGLKWATTNVGATKPEEYGLYFAWGETQGYADTTEKQFSLSDYKLCGGSDSTLTKYNTDSSYGIVDNLISLELSDDAAYVSDKTCRMPTKAELEELIANTTSTWKVLNDVGGRRFTSKTNGNSIFIPAAGYCDNGSVGNVGYDGYLWSSSLGESSSWDAWGLYFNSDDVYVSYGGRCSGLAVRAVQEPNTNTKFNPSETVSKVNNLESQIGDINTVLEEIINGSTFTIIKEVIDYPYNTPTYYEYTFNFTKGMTWGEWVNSGYNTASDETMGNVIVIGGIHSGKVSFGEQASVCLTQDKEAYVDLNDLIIKNHQYFIPRTGGSD